MKVLPGKNKSGQPCEFLIDEKGVTLEWNKDDYVNGHPVPKEVPNSGYWKGAVIQGLLVDASSEEGAKAAEKAKKKELVRERGKMT